MNLKWHTVKHRVFKVPIIQIPLSRYLSLGGERREEQ